MSHRICDIFTDRRYRYLKQIIDLMIWKHQIKKAEKELFKLLVWNEHSECWDDDSGMAQFNWRTCKEDWVKGIYNPIVNFKIIPYYESVTVKMSPNY